jgi:site-specific DNA recombinase
MGTMKAGIYVRISDDSKAEEKGQGVARQEKDCRDMAKRIGAEVGAVFVDNDASAYSGRVRPQYVALLSAIEAREIDLLIVWHPDRLHRSPRELEDFVELVERTGCEVRTVTAGDLDLATPEGRLVARITGAVARKESEDKSRRISRKLKELRETGKPPGRLGFAYDAGAVINPERLKIIEEAAERVLDGESCGAIAADFNARGIPTRLNGKWTFTAVRNIVTSPSLVSLMVHKGEIVGPGNWPPVMDRTTWDRIGAALAQTPKTPKGLYLLSGLVRCGCCGGHLIGALIYYTSGPVRGYRCRPTSAGGCGGVAIASEHLESQVLPRVERMLAGPMIAASEAGDDLAGQIEEAEARLLEYAALLDAGDLEMVEWKSLRGKVAERIKTLRARQEAATPPVGIAAGEAWETMTVARKRQIVAAMVAITVSKSKGGKVFDTSRVSIRWLQ